MSGGVEIVGTSPPYERRQERRIPLSVPVHVNWRERGSGGAVSSATGRSIDISRGGIALSLTEGGPFAPGEFVTVSLTVPSEQRKSVPFSLITGSARVVRVMSRGESNEEVAALAFCGHDVSMLGSIVYRS